MLSVPPRGAVGPLFALTGFLLLSILPVFARQVPSTPRILTAVRATAPLSIDGELREPEWHREGTKGFVQREPSEGEPLSEETEVWVAYDENALYVAARMFDSSPDSILGRLVRRDDDFGSDFLYFGIDPNHDRHNAYYFGTNPSGAINDGILYDDNKNDDSWDGIWEVAVQRESHGWTAEFRVPFSQIRFAKKDPYTWGIDFYRRIHRKNEEGFLVLHPRNDDIRVSRWPELIGIQGIEPPPRIEVLPYVTGTGKFLQKDPVATFNNGRDDPFVLGRDYLGSFGADAKIGLSGSFTLDASINPDFAQVEVDPAIVNLTAYETQYEEKRPFFMEGSTILRFGRGGAAGFTDYNWSDPSFFYSRRIGRTPQGSVTHAGFMSIPDRTTILGAAKVSGRTADGWSLAALTALTDREYGRVDSAGNRFKEEIEPMTFYGVLRSQRTFGESRQALGIIATLVERESGEPRLEKNLNRRAVSLGLDGWTFLDPEKDWVLTGWTGMTSVHGPRERITDLQLSPQHYFQKPDVNHVSLDSNATSLTGWAGRLWLSKHKGNWRFNVAFGAVNPSFESNDLGFHNHTDVINAHIYTGYLWFEPDAVFRSKSVAIATHRDYSFGGLKTGETYYAFAYGELLSYWAGSIHAGYNAEVFDDKRTRGGPLMKSLQSEFVFLSFNSDTRQDVHAYLNINASQGRSGGKNLGMDLTLNWKASTTLNLSFGPSYYHTHAASQYVDAIDDPSAVSTFGTRYIFSTLDFHELSASTRLNWTFTPRLSFQVYLQPLIATGHHSGFKELALPGSFSFTPYSYGSNPDFNFRSLRANAVLRWEYLPGSTLYLVWTNVKAQSVRDGVLKVGRDFHYMMKTAPNNVLSLKLTYWWAP